MLLKCDKCKHEFNAKLLEKKRGKYTEVYFTCDKCKHKYTVHYKSDKTELLRNKLNLARTEARIKGVYVDADSKVLAAEDLYKKEFDKLQKEMNIQLSQQL